MKYYSLLLVKSIGYVIGMIPALLVPMQQCLGGEK
jgi:hypothetical protein